MAIVKEVHHCDQWQLKILVIKSHVFTHNRRFVFGVLHTGCEFWGAVFEFVWADKLDDLLKYASQDTLVVHV